MKCNPRYVLLCEEQMNLEIDFLKIKKQTRQLFREFLKHWNVYKENGMRI